ncbi:hypothetical protein PoB_006777900 [Plakobranchus ocellatus]|uniref:Uncharacterized protein n=1 Tax=Plakobranchus ocellatus TaxID=259542 RepID=A0AAV4DAL3_9GAST|nr:hypothetical protein PoB_006777900 [Plakobranchus ocellatus]
MRHHPNDRHPVQGLGSQPALGSQMQAPGHPLELKRGLLSLQIMANTTKGETQRAVQLGKLRKNYYHGKQPQSATRTMNVQNNLEGTQKPPRGTLDRS